MVAIGLDEEPTMVPQRFIPVGPEAGGLSGAPVREASLDGELVVGELTLRPFEVHEALAIHRLVDHAGGDEIRRGAGKWKAAGERLRAVLDRLRFAFARFGHVESPLRRF